MPTNVQNLHTAGSLGEFGRVVGDARREKRLTQEEAANLLGLSRRKLIDIEAGRIELARYEKTGLLAVLSGHYEATIAECAKPARVIGRATWRRVLLGSPTNPRAWLDLEEESGQWWAACGFDNGRVGGLDTFHGPYGSREAAERNAAAFGRDFMRARGCAVMAQVIGRMFGFVKRKDECAKSAPLESSAWQWSLVVKAEKGWDVMKGGELVAEIFGPAAFVTDALKALNAGGTLDAGFEQRHGVEVFLPDGSSPSEIEK